MGKHYVETIKNYYVDGFMYNEVIDRDYSKDMSGALFDYEHNIDSLRYTYADEDTIIVTFTLYLNDKKIVSETF